MVLKTQKIQLNRKKKEGGHAEEEQRNIAEENERIIQKIKTDLEEIADKEKKKDEEKMNEPAQAENESFPGVKNEEGNDKNADDTEILNDTKKASKEAGKKALSGKSIGGKQKTKIREFGDIPKDKNFYELLDISPNATDKEIKDAWRKKAKEYHPDANSGDKKAEEWFRTVKDAYDTLKDSEKRNKYNDDLKEKERRAHMMEEVRKEQGALLTPFDKFTENVYEKIVVPIRYFMDKGWKRFLGEETIGSAENARKRYNAMVAAGRAEVITKPGEKEYFESAEKESEIEKKARWKFEDDKRYSHSPSDLYRHTHHPEEEEKITRRPDESLYKQTRWSDLIKHYTDKQGRRFHYRLVGDYVPLWPESRDKKTKKINNGQFKGTSTLYKIYD